MSLRKILVPLGVLVAVATAVAYFTPRERPAVSAETNVPDDLQATVQQVNRQFETRWAEVNLQPAEAADELTVLRRLSLVLHGTIPSLEEIRAFEQDTAPDRLTRWTVKMLEDPRFGEYMAERLARPMVGSENGAFIIFRRDRFSDWLSEQLHQNRPYDEMVREMLAGQGLWTGEPQTNFITAAYANDDLDENKLAARTVRAFLGQRIDCAQCHDHPFDDWKQQDFEGLAAFFGQTRLTPMGIEDVTVREKKPVEYEVEDRLTLEKRVVQPRVPFHEEWLPAGGTRRERLAAWVTHPDNRRFERAIAHRMWSLLLGRPYDIRGVDDLPDPDEAPDLLDLLGRDFREHGYDLRRLILVITSSRPFRLSSEYPAETEQELELAHQQWAAFELTRERPEQVIGSMLQATSVKTIDQNSHLVTRLLRLLRENDFIKEYGDLGDDEFAERSGTVAQALLRMNGKLTKESVETNFFNASARIESISRSDEQCLENCFLVCLTRRPTPEEVSALLPLLQETSPEFISADNNKEARQRAIEDIFWILFNSEEFSWNH